MPTSLVEASEQLKTRVLNIARKYHPEVMDLEPDIRIIVASNPDGDAIKLHGYPCLATIKKTSLEDRAAGKGDVLLKIDQDAINRLSATEFDALIDHEFTHLVPALYPDDHKDPHKAGRPKRDDLGRPVFKIKLHDWQLGGFEDVAKKHGQDAAEVQAVKMLGSKGVKQGWLQGF